MFGRELNIEICETPQTYKKRHTPNRIMKVTIDLALLL